MGFDVLDASAFYAGVPVASPQTHHTTPEVYSEIRHIKARCGAIDALIDIGRLIVVAPSPRSVQRILRAARDAGEAAELSRADVSVIALCVQNSGRLITDDYAVSNVAQKMGIMTIPVMTKGRRRFRRWAKYCPACGRSAGTEAICGVCGNALKRRLAHAP